MADDSAVKALQRYFNERREIAEEVHQRKRQAQQDVERASEAVAQARGRAEALPGDREAARALRSAEVRVNEANDHAAHLEVMAREAMAALSEADWSLRNLVTLNSTGAVAVTGDGVHSRPALSKDTQRELAGALQALQDDVRQVREQLHHRGGEHPAVEELEQRVQDVRRLAAPIVFPAAEDMAVRLVPASSLEQWDEYRSDEGLHVAAVSALAGAVLGLIGSLVVLPDGPSGPPAPRAFWALLSILIVCVVGEVGMVARYRRRATKARGTILSVPVPGSLQQSATLARAATGDDAVGG